jgi:hypothetical protein
MPEAMRYSRTAQYPPEWRRGQHLAPRRMGKTWPSPACEGQTKAFVDPTKPRSTRSSLELQFNELVKVWRKETAMHSSLTRKTLHPAYQRIIAMGPEVIPLILQELSKKPGHWFWALDALIQDEPSPAMGTTNLQEATDAWLRWGDAKGYL